MFEPTIRGGRFRLSQSNVKLKESMLKYEDATEPLVMIHQHFLQQKQVVCV